MRKAESLDGRWRNVVFLLTACLVVVADQLSKIWIRSNLEIGESLPETGFFRLTHVYNTGAVFGLFQDHSFVLLIGVLISVAILLFYVFFVYRRYPFLNNWPSNLALGLILGGAVGNLIDRMRFGYVTDFIDVGIWPSFNVADSAVVVGVIVLACSLLPLLKDGKDGDRRTT